MSTQDIQDCINLIENALPQNFPSDEANTIIGTTPEKILDGHRVALWAQSQSSEKSIFMRSPTLKGQLLALAHEGLGANKTHDGVKYKFIKRMSLQQFANKPLLIRDLEDSSRTTTPMSSLD
jgi:hypothetical protein